MCGIAALAGRFGVGALDAMTDCQQHRGPDDRGTEQRVLPDGRRIGVGSRRLAILDPSAAGRMPISDSQADIHVVHNGEIYNFLELRAEMEDRGYSFKTASDSEVLLRLWQVEGPEMLNRLEGMFAFAVWDADRGKIFAARDRLGIKPLFWFQDSRGVALASEIKGLLAVDSQRDVNWDAIWDYFTFLYIPGPATAWQGIRELSPGHYLEYDVMSDTVRIRRWWSAIDAVPKPEERPSSIEAAAAELRERMACSVRRRLISDVPLGAFLSGGIDSSVVVGLMAEAGASPLRTFTVLFSGAGMEPWNEKETADAVVNRWATEHHEVEVDISTPEDLLDLLGCFDQPFANPTYYLSWLVSHETRRHVKVALSGAGGDELFAGYPRYRAARWGRLAACLPAPAVSAARLLLGVMPDNYDSRLLRRSKLFLEGLHPDAVRRYASWVYYLDEKEKRNLLRPGRLPDLPDSTRLLRRRLEEAKAADLDWLSRLQYLDLTTFLPDNILAYTDRTSMAASLEVRVPWLDHSLAGWSLGLPAKWKLRGRKTKVVVRRAFDDLMPPETKKAPKRGFVPPLARWIDGILDRYLEDCLLSDHLQRDGVLRAEAIGKMRSQHQAGQRDYSMELFAFIVFDAWYKRYVE